jgi:hypothetical protein
MHRTEPAHGSVWPNSISKLAQGHADVNWLSPPSRWLARARLGTVPTTHRRRPPALRPDRASFCSDARHLPPGLHVPRMQQPPSVQCF